MAQKRGTVKVMSRGKPAIGPSSVGNGVNWMAASVLLNVSLTIAVGVFNYSAKSTGLESTLGSHKSQIESMIKVIDKHELKWEANSIRWENIAKLEATIINLTASVNRLEQEIKKK